MITNLMALTDPTVLALVLTGGASIFLWNIFKKKVIKIEYANDENGKLVDVEELKY